MKKKIVLGLSIFSLVFFVGGIYIITTIKTGTSTLDNLIQLHQIEILREHLLIQIKRVQSALYLKDTSHARGMDEIVRDVMAMSGVARTCLDCHHTASVQARLEEMNRHVEAYKDTLSRVLTIRAGAERRKEEEEAAYHAGEMLVTEVDGMIAAANSKLQQRTDVTLVMMKETELVLIILVALAPILATALGFVFVRAFSEPLGKVLEGTRRLRNEATGGEIEPLKDEFGELARSINEMAASLKEHMAVIDESEKRYRTLFERAGDAIFILEAEGDRPGAIVAANQAAAVMHGYTKEELLDLRIQDLDTPDSAKNSPALIGRILQGDLIQAELTHRKKDGTVFPVEVRAGLLELAGHKYILAIDRDVTERKKMEEALVQSKQDWEDVFDSITDMITVYDKDRAIVRANRAASANLSLLQGEALRCSVAGGGTEQPAVETAAGSGSPGTGRVMAYECYEPRIGRYLDLRAIPRLSSEGQLIGLIHIVRDVTERKRTEEALQRAEQMRCVGELAAGLAHEIKNPLAGLKASIEMVAEAESIPDEDRDILARGTREIERIEVLVRDLLNFARPPKPQFRPVEVNKILDETLTFLLRKETVAAGKEPVAVVKDFDEQLSKVMGDPMQLKQIFTNLVLNARDAMPQGGMLTVRTSHDTVAGSVIIQLSDTGKGIKREALDRIFEPFFTTKQRGTGLGLAITKRLVEGLRGTIAVMSEEAKGTVFTITLPVSQGNMEGA